jgi:hypothetical protein
MSIPKHQCGLITKFLGFISEPTLGRAMKRSTLLRTGVIFTGELKEFGFFDCVY